jgi:hypothetical protein
MFDEMLSEKFSAIYVTSQKHRKAGYSPFLGYPSVGVVEWGESILLT